MIGEGVGGGMVMSEHVTQEGESRGCGPTLPDIIKIDQVIGEIFETPVKKK